MLNKAWREDGLPVKQPTIGGSQWIRRSDETLKVFNAKKRSNNKTLGDIYD